jgi:hypothetical protein
MGRSLKHINFAVMAASLAIALPVFAGAPTEQSTLTAPPTSFETGGDPDDVIADRFWSIIDANLAIKFSLTDGTQPDGIEITVKNAAGQQAFDTRTDGPLLFTRLPEGNYSIEATWRDTTIKRDVTLSSVTQAKLTINWDDTTPAQDQLIEPN